LKSPRERAIARIKTLAAAGVVVGCHGSGYGVVDPMPMPACFESPEPVVTAKVVETKDDGTRLVELLVKFQQTDAKVGQLDAYRIVEFGGGSHKLEITEKTINANDFRVVISVPQDVKHVLFSAEVQCSRGNGFNAELELDESGAVKITRAR
jgi:hypothetical protein